MFRAILYGLYHGIHHSGSETHCVGIGKSRLVKYHNLTLMTPTRWAQKPVTYQQSEGFSLHLFRGEITPVLPIFGQLIGVISCYTPFLSSRGPACREYDFVYNW